MKVNIGDLITFQHKDKTYESLVYCVHEPMLHNTFLLSIYDEFENIITDLYLAIDSPFLMNIKYINGKPI